MGLLAEAKSRTKISNDPNNTKWSRDTKTFGQRILRSQGWEPGQYLGVQDAPHSELHTAASASYIRVSLKDDMKGLGFDRAKGDEVTGLDVFSDLLNRLNGKSEEAVESDKQARLVVKKNLYVEQRWGPMRFVKGGFLEGDQVAEVKKEEDSLSSVESRDIKEELDETDQADLEASAPKKSKKGKKRKAASTEAADADSSSKEAEPEMKKRRKEERKGRKNRNKELGSDVMVELPVHDLSKSKKEKKVKDKPHKRGRSGRGPEDDTTKAEIPKEEKKEKKEKKQRRRKEQALDSDSGSAPLARDETVASADDTQQSTPTGTGASTPQGSRNYVRSRFIAQKKQALLDTKALNQIFMLKA